MASILNFVRRAAGPAPSDSLAVGDLMRDFSIEVMPRTAAKDLISAYDVGYYQTFDPTVAPPHIAGPVGAGFNTILRLEINTGKLKRLPMDESSTVQEHAHIAARRQNPPHFLRHIGQVRRLRDHRRIDHMGPHRDRQRRVAPHRLPPIPRWRRPARRDHQPSGPRD